VIRLFSLALLGAGAAFFHTHLSASFPKANEVVTKAPAEITLTFTARPELPLTRIGLFTADSTPLKLDRVRPGRDTLSVAARVVTPLPTGKYIVTWRTASRDGHMVHGSYHFGYSTDPAAAHAAAAHPMAARPAEPAAQHNHQ
jgi:methionine-rich copper-binding protein CopC